MPAPAAAAAPDRSLWTMARRAERLNPSTVKAGTAFVPGATFFPHRGHANTLRLRFAKAAR